MKGHDPALPSLRLRPETRTLRKSKGLPADGARRPPLRRYLDNHRSGNTTLATTWKTPGERPVPPIPGPGRRVSVRVSARLGPENPFFRSRPTRLPAIPSLPSPRYQVRVNSTPVGDGQMLCWPGGTTPSGRTTPAARGGADRSTGRAISRGYGERFQRIGMRREPPADGLPGVWRGGSEDGVDVARMWALAPGWIGAAEPCWSAVTLEVPRPARRCLWGAYSADIPENAPGRRGAGAGPPGTARSMAQPSPQHQGHLVTGPGHSARGAAVRGAGAGRSGAGRSGSPGRRWAQLPSGSPGRRRATASTTARARSACGGGRPPGPALFHQAPKRRLRAA